APVPADAGAQQVIGPAPPAEPAPAEPAAEGGARGRLRIPSDLPGADAPPITNPANEEERRKLYPAMEELGDEPRPVPGPGGRPLTLADLQQLALTRNPLIGQARAAVQSARGAAIQAGLCPNPNFGYQ